MTLARNSYTTQMIGGSGSGVVLSPDQIVPITLTVIGGRSSGKTTLMAGFFREFLRANASGLSLEPVPPEVGTAGTTENTLPRLVTEIYQNYNFPLGDVNCSSMPMILRVVVQNRSGNVQVPIARINLLDYPGGVWAGMAHLRDTPEYRIFWNRVAHSDGLILVADGSELRRKEHARDWEQVRDNYNYALDLVARRNGNQRVVPVALAITKCDEYIDPQTQQVNEALLLSDFRNPAYGYPALEGYWRARSNYGRYRVFTTTTITNSEPTVNAHHMPDARQPFRMNPSGPGGIYPQGCAAPILWCIATVLRFNITLFSDLKGFIKGASAREHRVMEVVRQLEDLAIRFEGTSFLPRILTELQNQNTRMQR